MTLEEQFSEIIEDIFVARLRVETATGIERQARQNYDGYSWDWAGREYIENIDEAKALYEAKKMMK